MSGTSVFVYGTLRDRDLLSLVCEQPVDFIPSEMASLPGYEPRYVHDKVFPVLVTSPGSNTIGEVMAFSDELLERIVRYETAGFALRNVSVKLDKGDDFNCHYFANVGFSHVTNRLWTLTEWQLLYKKSWMAMLRDL